ncbi:hypothetical protein M5K25_004716 [Dendrobium thyrsiflorum]|uniref:Uncharacterized protein n=1 Tax=Dendrobium thyrsiflorum TaxID=117978 RepID=A0ABD0VGE0_DENTH
MKYYFIVPITIFDTNDVKGQTLPNEIFAYLTSKHKYLVISIPDHLSMSLSSKDEQQLKVSNRIKELLKERKCKDKTNINDIDTRNDLIRRSKSCWNREKCHYGRVMRMVRGVMMSPIKIPWFRRSGPSWSLVYLVRGGSRPNLTEGSLSAAMGCFVQGYLADLGEHTGNDHDRNIMVPFGGKPPGSEGPGRNRLPTVPFDGKIVGARGHRGRKSLQSHHVKKYVYGVMSERSTVVSLQAGTYEYPFLAVSVVPVSHPTALEKSAYRQSAGPSRTPKKGFWITRFVTSTATHFLLPR